MTPPLQTEGSIFPDLEEKHHLHLHVVVTLILQSCFGKFGQPFVSGTSGHSDAHPLVTPSSQTSKSRAQTIWTQHSQLFPTSLDFLETPFPIIPFLDTPFPISELVGLTQIITSLSFPFPIISDVTSTLGSAGRVCTFFLTSLTTSATTCGLGQLSDDVVHFLFLAL
jgi:hypothetical protein